MTGDVQIPHAFRYIEHVDLLNASGDVLAHHVQRGLVRAGMKDITILSTQPTSGRRLILRYGPLLYRLHVYPAKHKFGTPEDQPGWLPLLVSTHFDETAIHELTEAQISFLDDMGNAHVSLDGRTVLFNRHDKPGQHEVHNKAATLPTARRASGTLTLNRSSHRVVFSLLAHPELAGRPVRALAATARVSVGTVHNALAQLTNAGHLLDRKLHNSGRLLTAWADAYCRLAIRPLAPRALYARDEHWSDRIRLEPTNGVLLGGIAAAAVLDSQVRAADGIVYAPTLGSAVTLLHLTAMPTPFRVEVRDRFWGDGLPSSQAGLVPSVLIYGDLLRDGDARSLDIAMKLRENDAHLRLLG